MEQLAGYKYNKMRRILSDMQADPQAWAFLQPVSAEDVPDYYTVIKNPMGRLYVVQFANAKLTI